MAQNARETREERCITADLLPAAFAQRSFACPARLTLPDPAHRRLRPQLGRRLVLAVTPGAAPAAGMLLTATAPTDHRQAAFAFARRIRLRRSAERSSSFKPPQVPYFSGLLTA